jgi:hydroxyethylthiazole kinase-like uncharacterized protein yjeF
MIGYRIAAKDDLRGILALYRSWADEEQAAGHKIEIAAAEAVFQRAIANGAVYFIATDNDTIIASCYVAVIPNLTWSGRSIAFIENVITDKQYRRQGIGKAVMLMALDYAKNCGCYKVTLQSNAKRCEAHGFYRAMGFDGGTKLAFEMRLQKKVQNKEYAREWLGDNTGGKDEKNFARLPAFGPEDIRDLIPSRPSDMNKTDRGRILVAGGSENYPGAAALSTRAALRSGSGIVSLLSLPQVCFVCASRLPEAVQLPADRPSWLETALKELPRTNAAVAGPGLGRSAEAIAFATELWKTWNRPLLMDGDALYALAVSPEQENLPPRQNTVLTPHEGEAARLLAATPEYVRQNRAEAAERLSRRWGCVLLKGEGTIVASNGGAAYNGRNPVRMARLSQGGPELSVPGSGDVLSGCIGAFLAQGLEPFEAACFGGTLHGMAGARLKARKGVDGILASEIADELPFVLRQGRGPWTRYGYDESERSCRPLGGIEEI